MLDQDLYEENITGVSTDTTVVVRLVDSGTGETIARSSIPASSLPTYFYPRQSIVLYNVRWLISQAEPAHAKDYLREGAVTLTVRLPEFAAVAESHFILPYPTRCDTVPPLAPDTTKAGKDVLALQEDDWRQVEFVALSQHDAVEYCLSNISEVIKTSRVRNGYRKAHVRSEVPDPLYGVNIPAMEVQSLFGEEMTPFAGICYDRFAGLISGGFGLETNTGIRVYGTQENGIVRALGLAASEPRGNFRNHAAILREFASVHRLAIVDWVQTRYVKPDVEEYRLYFG